MRCDVNAKYDSSLAPDGAVSWSRHDVYQRIDAGASLASSNLETLVAKFDVSFPDIDWKCFQSVYGWAALQWQAWARGSLILAGHEPRKVLLNIENSLEFWLDGQHYFGGDYYAYSRAPYVFHLEPGHHSLNVRLVRDVRSMGSIGQPDLSIRIIASVVEEDLVFLPQSSVFPDVVNGKPAGSYCSIALLNTNEQCCQIQKIEILERNGSRCKSNVSPTAVLRDLR